MSNFVITRTENDFSEIAEESFSHGMVYPYPHFFVFMVDDASKDYAFVKMRPLVERCGNIRDSALNNNGVGIVVKTDGEKLDEKANHLIAVIIKSIIDDLGVKNHSIVSDEVNNSRFVDTFDIAAKVVKIPSQFAKNPNI